MSDRSRYVFGAALAGVALGGVAGVVDKASAAPVTNAQFTFESSFSGVTSLNSTGGTVASVTAASFGPLVAESGTGSAYGVHAASNTVYSVPAGNGSPHAFSSNNWAPNDYYQFSVPTSGIQNLLVTFDQSSSATGPGHFILTASADGTSFSNISSYTVAFSSTTGTATSTNTAGSTTTSGTVGFATGSSNTNFSFSFDLSGVTSLNDNASAIFRLVDADTVADNPTGTVATAGTDRVDNFIVSGTAVAGTPEPAGLALVGVAAAAGLARRRRRD